MCFSCSALFVFHAGSREHLSRCRKLHHVRSVHSTSAHETSGLSVLPRPQCTEQLGHAVPKHSHTHTFSHRRAQCVPHKGGWKRGWGIISVKVKTLQLDDLQHLCQNTTLNRADLQLLEKCPFTEKSINCKVKTSVLSAQWSEWMYVSAQTFWNVPSRSKEVHSHMLPSLEAKCALCSQFSCFVCFHFSPHLNFSSGMWGFRGHL